MQNTLLSSCNQTSGSRQAGHRKDSAVR